MGDLITVVVAGFFIVLYLRKRSRDRDLGTVDHPRERSGPFQDEE